MPRVGTNCSITKQVKAGARNALLQRQKIGAGLGFWALSWVVALRFGCCALWQELGHPPGLRRWQVGRFALWGSSQGVFWGGEMLSPLPGCCLPACRAGSDSPGTAKSLKPYTNGSGLLMDMGPCHLLGASDTACGSASPAWGCWGCGWAPPAPSLGSHPCPGCAGAVLGGWGWSSGRACPQPRGTTEGSGMRLGGSPALVGSQNQRDEALSNPFPAARPPWGHIQCLMDAAADVSHGCAALQEVGAVGASPGVVYQQLITTKPPHSPVPPAWPQPWVLPCSQPLTKARSGRTLREGQAKKNTIDFFFLAPQVRYQ